MARRIAPVAEKHGEIFAIDLAIEVGIACGGKTLGWIVDQFPVGVADWIIVGATLGPCISSGINTL